VVEETLREWCEQQQRSPQADEQRGIAQTQHDRIEQAAAEHDVVVADTTALMTAVYSRLVWADASLDAWAAGLHANTVDLTLFTANDIAWVPDGLQRDGPHVREPVAALLRELLTAHGIAWSQVSGVGEQRLSHALAAVAPAIASRFGRQGAMQGLFTRLTQREGIATTWRWVCTDCDDPDCEHTLRKQ
jgi:nicotinamide riboside kinase